jgi:hypothetical protein
VSVRSSARRSVPANRPQHRLIDAITWSTPRPQPKVAHHQPDDLTCGGRSVIKVAARPLAAGGMTTPTVVTAPSKNDHPRGSPVRIVRVLLDVMTGDGTSLSSTGALPTDAGERGQLAAKRCLHRIEADRAGSNDAAGAHRICVTDRYQDVRDLVSTSADPHRRPVERRNDRRTT